MREIQQIIQPSTRKIPFQYIGIIVIIQTRPGSKFEKCFLSSLAALCRVKLLPIDAEDIAGDEFDV
jgi:hypothetical protein